MWQQNPFRADNRFLKEYTASDHQQPVDSFFRRIDSASSTLISLVASSRSGSVTSDLDWQRIAGLVQSPASANSEGSSTSTPDQCPASPTRTFCEMPASSRNGSCNNSMSEGMQKQNVWEDLPSQPSTVASLMDLECGKWPATSQAPQRASETGHLFSDEEQPAGWNPIENRAKMSTGGYTVDESLVSNALMSRNCSQPSVPGSLHFQIRNNLQKTASSEEQTFSSAYRLDMRDPPMIKQEEEYFLGGRNGLIIDGKVLSLHRTSTSNSKIGNFMDLLRQSNTPILDATTAASCSHLSHLLSSQEAPEMWVAQSSRLPAMLSEVLPLSSGGKSGIESFEARNKRKLLECSTSDVDTQDRRSTVQHHEGLKQQQDEGEPSNGVATNDSELFSKKPKIENSNFPFKMQVRKEKLGERISALQQLVSPFGKTDTASVLLEAIGYIKFLHEQVQVLSSPYMKHTAIRHNEQGDEIKQDLRSRGLCLVPVSCTLQVANDNGADYWTPTLHAGLK